jgi:chloramphenicol 3-O-phosphotransferase
MVALAEPRSVPQTAANRQPPPGRRKVAFGTIKPQGHKIVLYGTGGIGKTSEASVAPGPVAFNHWLDALVGCAVAASMVGIKVPGETTPKRQRKRYSQDDLRRRP